MDGDSIVESLTNAASALHTVGTKLSLMKMRRKMSRVELVLYTRILRRVANKLEEMAKSGD